MNPLIEPSPLKHAAVPFDLLKPHHFPQALDHAIERGKEILKAIKTKPASFANTLEGLESSTEEMEFVFTTFNNLLSAHSNEELQELSMTLGPKVAAFVNDIILDPEIFAKVESVYKERKNAKLNEQQVYLVEKVYRDFQRSGAALDDEKKSRLREIDQRLSQLHPTFRDHVLKANNAFELWITDPADLAGLPESAKMAAREEALAKGQGDKWLFTLHQPSYLPFMKFSEKRELREKMERARSSKAFNDAFDNQSTILEIVSLMQEKSRILGAPSYAHYALQTRMAETPETVFTFLNRLMAAAKPAALREMDEVQKLAETMGFKDKIQAWDFAYYAEKLKEKKYDFDEEQLRPYFKLENVLNGVFEHARRLFGLTFKESTDYPVYHEDVRVFEVFKGDRDFVGLFYTDFFPRASKSQGAWMTNFYEQGVFRGQKIRPHVSIVCNFSKPTAEMPALLDFSEVLTLFHEFGHALHSLLSRVDYRSLAGTNVFLDFVELPSQILENWADEEESLKVYAFHYKTGEPIPMELIERLKRSQKFLVGYQAMRQLNFAFLDLAWFANPPVQGQTVAEFEEKATANSQIFPRLPGANISASFGHIFGGGYASGYYSYKWAEALDADAFELFKERGIFDPSVAGRFEEFILSKGGSDHPMRLYEKFRGRSPDPEALLRRDGLLES